MTNTIHIKDIQITYMGRTCTIEDFIKYGKDPKKCEDLSKIGAIVYIKAQVEDIEIPRGYFNTDYLVELFNADTDCGNFLVIKIIQRLKLKEVPDFILELLAETNEDKKFDLFLKFCRKTMRS